MELIALYRNMLLKLLPPGDAFSQDAESVGGKSAEGSAVELARVHQRSQSLLLEMDPRTTVELLPDWERTFGLSAGALTIAERQKMLTAKVNASEKYPQRKQSYIDLAERFGYTISIDEFRPFQVGSHAGDLCWSTNARFFFRVNIIGLPHSYFGADSFAGETLKSDTDFDIEALIQKKAASHMTPIIRIL